MRIKKAPRNLVVVLPRMSTQHRTGHCRGGAGSTQGKRQGDTGGGWQPTSLTPTTAAPACPFPQREVVCDTPTS